MLTDIVNHCQENCKYFCGRDFKIHALQCHFLAPPASFCLPVMGNSQLSQWRGQILLPLPSSDCRRFFFYVSLCSFHYWVLLVFLRAYQNPSNSNLSFILKYKDTWKQLSCLPTPKCSLGEASTISSSSSHITWFGLTYHADYSLLHMSELGYVYFKLKWKELVVKYTLKTLSSLIRSSTLRHYSC